MEFQMRTEGLEGLEPLLPWVVGYLLFLIVLRFGLVWAHKSIRRSNPTKQLSRLLVSLLRWSVMALMLLAAWWASASLGEKIGLGTIETGDGGTISIGALILPALIAVYFGLRLARRVLVGVLALLLVGLLLARLDLLEPLADLIGDLGSVTLPVIDRTVPIALLAALPVILLFFWIRPRLLRR